MHAYYRYLIGNCPMPQTFKQSVLFTLLMAAGMGVCMITVVALITEMSADMYLFMLLRVMPSMIIIGAFIRLFVCTRPIDAIIRRNLAPRLDGAALSFGVVLVNVAFMATIMCALGTAVGCVISAGSWEGLVRFQSAYLGILPAIYLSAIPISFLLVGPASKLFFSKLIPR